jgi:hypothetical protein
MAVLKKRKQRTIGVNNNMEPKNVNPKGDNVVASNLNNAIFFFFVIYENWVQKQTSYMNARKIEIVHLTNEHWMSQSFPYWYGYIPEEQKNEGYFGSIFGVLSPTRILAL